jgi:hypothetical protein
MLVLASTKKTSPLGLGWNLGGARDFRRREKTTRGVRSWWDCKTREGYVSGGTKVSGRNESSKSQARGHESAGLSRRRESSESSGRARDRGSLEDWKRSACGETRDTNLQTSCFPDTTQGRSRWFLLFDYDTKGEEDKEDLTVRVVHPKS